ncbi:hypothetical protein Bca101_005249 [Brassica carinata]
MDYCNYAMIKMIKVIGKGCSEASKLRAHPLKDIPLLDRLYARVTVSVKEGWQPHAGPSKLRDAPNPFTQKSNLLNRLENRDHVEREKLLLLINK